MSSPYITQTEAVRRALEVAGGMATLGALYRIAPHIEGSIWSGTKTPFASIRRIVQTSDLFWKVQPGLWALKTEEKRLTAEHKIPAKNTSSAAIEKFNHSYYQGLLVQWGSFEGHRTSVPAQDKNRLFLKDPLYKLATFTVPPSFTFDHLINRAKTIDVGWYNQRNFPHAFFEVEHSTDISNSLGKFVDFQDFRTRFVIVADELRRNEWNSKMSQAQFASIRGRVDFLSYESLATSHANAAQKATLPSF
ncbi:hypothetical protein IAD21_01880 [Abditibacteriota bacterium]|nr:hypothetical protein IAD21_01880 [Abditibacteriota bacterium]